MESKEECDVVVVGAGIAGLLQLRRVQQLGLKGVILEAANDVGGTWFHNSYPGARCDVIAAAYMLPDPELDEWTWTEKYATQKEIHRYISFVADKYNSRPHIRFNQRVKSAQWVDNSKWIVKTNGGLEVVSQYLVLATGCLSAPVPLSISGVDDAGESASEFKGIFLRTSTWNAEQAGDLAGKVVGVIGTGSSAAQAIVEIAKVAKELIVFQRTANYVIPAHHRTHTEDEIAELKSNRKRQLEVTMQTAFGIDVEMSTKAFAEFTEEEREKEIERRWSQLGGFYFSGVFADLAINPEAEEYANNFIRGKIRSIVKDQAVAELLCPKQGLMCKRILIVDDYYPTFNRDNVKLVSIADGNGIEAVTESGIKTSEGIEYKLDVIVNACGFDAMTGAATRIEIVGEDNTTLKDQWRDGAKTYLGIQTVNFPNLYFITGPQSPSVLSNMMLSIDQSVSFITDLLAYMAKKGKSQSRVDAAMQEQWVAETSAIAGFTLLGKETCKSWYFGSNVPGKPRVFTPYLGFSPYRDKCEGIAKDGYTGFQIS